MGKRVRAALNQFRVQADQAALVAANNPTDAAAVAEAEAKANFLAGELASFNAAEANKSHGIAKFRPKNVQAMAKNSILNPKVAIKDIGDTARAGLKGNFSDKRANLRAHHEKTIHPFQSRAQDIVKADKMINSNDPAVVAQGRALRADADLRTEKRGRIGAAVGVAFLGASAAVGGSSAAGATAAPGTTSTGLFGTGYGVKEIAGAAVAANKALQQRKAAEESSGIADTANSNGELYDPFTGAPYRGTASQYAEEFFGGYAPVAAGGGMAACGSAGSGDPWLFCIGMGFFVVALLFKLAKRVNV